MAIKGICLALSSHAMTTTHVSTPHVVVLCEQYAKCVEMDLLQMKWYKEIELLPIKYETVTDGVNYQVTFRVGKATKSDGCYSDFMEC